ncbi:3-deoxy-D-manno-octulosonic acid transferase [Motiliproteus coralliicola]|uniref:3-deoxy-D-manno-octulosonic acid transferase n=1 Tax=Motiliproteus coralliicola TaxID=2283196 RepID=UPI001401F137|nr:3-deoxy-D-manno-octulosonic acid transferase [Motiliproteus coralliicola]
MSRLIYQLLLALAAPLLLWLGRKQDPARWRERLGRYPGELPQRPIWLHAASFGEAKAAGVLIDAIRSAGYTGPWLVTTTTATGAEEIGKTLHPGDRHLYAPLDSKAVVKRALDQIQPQLLLVMEVEIWPNLWAECARQQVPVVLANARLSESSMRSYQRYLPALWRSTLAKASLILAQDENIASRFSTLGVAEQQLRLGGNLKYAQPLPSDITRQGEAIRQILGTKRPVWLAASTHDGEEAIALECHRQLLAQQPDALLVLVPRHPQRFETVAQLCRQSGLSWQRRSDSKQEPVADDCQLYLADSLGELLPFYAAADLCWVAGSFVDVGGHNILEPASCGCPMLVGPDMRNFETINRQFVEAGGLIQVDDQAALAEQVVRLMPDSEARARLAESARQRLQGYQDVALKQAEAVLDSLKQSAP